MTISATDFKAKCLQLLDKVRHTGEVIYITKHGKVIAELGPVSATDADASGPGVAKGTLTIVGDIIEPYDAVWETK